jgi:hypothetical protein
MPAKAGIQRGIDSKTLDPGVRRGDEHRGACLGKAVTACCAILIGLGVAPAAANDRGMADGVARGHALLRQAPRTAPVLIAIIIDDLGQQRAAGLRAAHLPGSVALAFLPDASHTRAQATVAHALGKEVLLHLPLEPGAHARRYPTGITQATARDELGSYVRGALAAVPFASGINNHQGSLLTELPQQMDWLMEEMGSHPGLYFVDSRTTAASVAYRAARARGIPAAERSVFLDTERGEPAVRQAFAELIAKARRNGRALAIGHPYPETFKVLEEELPQLARYGVRLVAPSQLIARQSGWRGPFPPLKLTPSLTLATRTRLPALPISTSAAAR